MKSVWRMVKFNFEELRMYFFVEILVLTIFDKWLWLFFNCWTLLLYRNYLCVIFEHLHTFLIFSAKLNTVQGEGQMSAIFWGLGGRRQFFWLKHILTFDYFFVWMMSTILTFTTYGSCELFLTLNFVLLEVWSHVWVED